jgi:zinc-ribbon domain
MVQSLTRYCPRCGTSVPATQMFCQNCGAPTDAKMVKAANQPTSAVIPPPPPPESLVPPHTTYSQQASPRPLQTAQPLPAYARPQKNSSGLRRLGFGAVLLLLLVVVVIGTAGFGAVRYLGSHLPGGAGHPYLNTPGGQAPVTTTQLNTTVTYASVVITIVNAQQATSFPNDNGAPGLLRLNLHEQNTNTPEKSLVLSTVSYIYADAFHVILPGGKSIAPLDSQLVTGPVQGKSQSGWVDFPVSATLKVSSLLLRLGTETQAPMDVPLVVHPALSQYQPRQVSVGTQAHYGNLLVTLSSATTQFSYGGQQADKGMRFLVVALSIANPTSSDVIANPPDFLRLQTGGTLSSPQGSTTLPTSFSANTASSTGEAAFLVPQNEIAFTLVFLASDSTGATSQATIAFQMR